MASAPYKPKSGSSNKLISRDRPNILALSKILTFLFVSLSLALCSPLPSSSSSDTNTPWRYGDLRLLDPPDAPNPALDGIAAYARQTSEHLEIRLDLLEADIQPLADIYIAMDTQPGGAQSIPQLSIPQTIPRLQWDILFILKNAHSSIALNTQNQPLPELNPLINWDSENDYLTVRLPNAAFQDATKHIAFQVFIGAAGSNTVADQLNIFHLDGAPPLNRSRVAFVFWDTLPAQTPALALRHWNGAHAGPLGQRHGLYHLLKAASQAQIPLLLLDLKQPQSYKALEYMGHISFIRQLEAQRMLILAEFTDPLTHLNTMRLETLAVTDTTPQMMKPLSREGITPELKQALISNAFSPQRHTLILGGSLPHSLWGESSIAPSAFQYFANHPWINVLDHYDLQMLSKEINPRSTTTEIPSYIPENTANQIKPLLEQLKELPEGQLTENAWRYYHDLTSPSQDERLWELRMTHLKHLERLIIAAHWAQKPVAYSSCALSFDPDACILASEETFAYLEKPGARLLIGASLSPAGAWQWAAPLSQLAIGLSDPADWKIENGKLTDPNEIPAAFADESLPVKVYHTQASHNQIIFTDQESNIQKIFSIQGKGLQVEYQAPMPIETIIPMVSLPIPRYPLSKNEEDLYPELVLSDAEYRAITCWDSRQWMSKAENPNSEYPPGHYLPYPLKVFYITSSGSFKVFILPQ